MEETRLKKAASAIAVAYPPNMVLSNSKLLLGSSILRLGPLDIREPILAKHLFRQFLVNVWRYQFAKCNRSRVVLSIAAAGPALW
jgi:hypothetical protein